MKASPLPWAITTTSKNGKEISDANGMTVAKLTALDMPNAELIVESVNTVHKQQLASIDIPKCWTPTPTNIKHITDVAMLEVDKDYWLVSKRYAEAPPTISKCKVIESKGWKYFDGHIWAMEDNNQAMEYFDIFGPLEPHPVPNFEALKTKK